MRLISALLLAAVAAPAFAADNTPPEGFVALFNGKDLTGWKGHIDMNERKKSAEEQAKIQEQRDKIVAASWKVVDGVIVHTPSTNEKGQKVGASLQTVKDYGDIELLIDWKIEKAGDSGLYLRGNPQVQIWDSENLSPSLKADANTGSGGLWNNPAGSPGKTPLKKADKPVGEWNTFFIRMVGEKATVYLNGELVTDDVTLENYWDRKQPIFPKEQIELQNHGNTLWFKNVYVRELTGPKAAAKADPAALAAALDDARPAVRAAAAAAVGKLGRAGQPAVPALVKAATDPEPAVRAAAVRALADTRSPDALEPIVNGLDDEDEAVRRSAKAAFEARMYLLLNDYQPGASPDQRRPAVARARQFIGYPTTRERLAAWEQKLIERGQ
jgi:hypothetical protein